MPALKFEILIVDDDAELASNLRRLLEMEGYGTTLASDGQTALDLCQRQSFDLAIVDIELPDRPGLKLVWHLARKMKENETGGRES